MDKYFIVPPKDAYENRDRIMDFLDDVRDSVSQEFNFHYEFICGSVKCKMVAFTRRNNDGMNFDVDIVPHLNGKSHTPKQIKDMVITALNKYTRQYGFSFAENSTGVITIKVKDKKNSKIKYSGYTFRM